MKRYLLIILSLSFIFFGWGGNKFNSQVSANIPVQISDFYRDYNFVCSFSTQTERMKLISYFDGETLLEEIRSKRLDKIFQMMKDIKNRVLIVDPEMVIWVKPSSSCYQYVFHPEIIEIKDIILSSGKALVDVLVYELEPEVIVKFIYQYDENKGDEARIPSEEERIRIAKSRIIQKKEFHRWFLQNERWMKFDANIIQLKSTK